MCKSKNIYKTHESIRDNYSYTSIPSCDREILLILTVILFIISQNSSRIYGKYQNENNTKRYVNYQSKSSKKKDNIIKSDIISNEKNEAPSEVFTKNCDKEINPVLPIINQFENAAKSNTSQQHGNINTKNCDKEIDRILLPIETKESPSEVFPKDFHKEINPVLPIINQFDNATESNTSQQHDNINNKNCDKEIVPILLPLEINKHPEEISTPDCFIENHIPPINKSNLSDIDTREKYSKTLVPLAKMLKNDYRGVMVCAILPNGITVSGEVAFNFNGIVALKHNTIIFINENYIISFY